MDPPPDTELIAREYQFEMLEHSRKGNVIVAMDTGSGKTAIALLRMREELESSVAKRIWFICPTVALAEQQCRVIKSYLSEFQTRILSGNDGVDAWTNQEIWDKVLFNINIVVSTPQVLLDALVHGFVHLRNMGLIIYDEAHHCIGGNPTNRIMQMFYHSAESSKELPAILGLTASPTIRGKEGSLQSIEQNLDALAKTPKIHREALLNFVHKPELHVESYCLKLETAPVSPMLKALDKMYEEMDIEKDPYVVHLKETHSEEFKKVFLTRQTYCQEEINSLCRLGLTVEDELGAWAADRFIAKCVDNFMLSVAQKFLVLESIENKEKHYLRTLFMEHVLNLTPLPKLADSLLSPKVLLLIDILMDRMSAGSAGIVFVKTRAVVYLLADMLNLHEKTQKFKIRTFVGSSTYSKRKKKLNELSDIKAQKDTLQELRAGFINLLICTNVCEEGIDISVCDVVICYDPPANLKSFVQRRGRARAAKSTFTLMLPKNDSNKLEEWKRLEENMIKQYMDDMRELEEIELFESSEEGSRELLVERTEARIQLQDAVQHLHHFCSKLPATAYTVLKPMYTFETDEATKLIRCRVLLPNSVHASVREAQSSALWKTQRMARKDAAFEAYAKLYSAGLVNDNLLPIPLFDQETSKIHKETKELPHPCPVEGQFNPWPTVATAWQSSLTISVHLVVVDSKTSPKQEMLMIAPHRLPEVTPFTLFIDTESSLTVSICFQAEQDRNSELEQIANKITQLLFLTTYAPRMRQDVGFPLLFVPNLPLDSLESWLHNVTGSLPARTLWLSPPETNSSAGLITCSDHRRYLFYGIQTTLPTQIDHELAEYQGPWLKVQKRKKRTDFLHPIPTDAKPRSQRFDFIDPNTAQVDNLPSMYAEFAATIPCIMHRISLALLADAARQTILSPVGFSSSHVVLPALCASGARESEDYQRLEFLGDSILKLIASSTLMAQHENWHEGYLSFAKDRIVSNRRLALASRESGLARFIVTKIFTGLKWAPLYNQDLVELPLPNERLVSTKILADVIEALVGAAFLDGNNSFEKAIKVLRVFMPEVNWSLPSINAQSLLSISRSTTSLGRLNHISTLETLLGHAFDHPVLLAEAITHPSHISVSHPTPSYQRLEFLGDSVLDYLVTIVIFSHPSALRPHQMHLLRSAAVNAAFLSFCVFSNTISTPLNPPSTQPSEPSEEQRSLLSFLRAAHIPALEIALALAKSRYITLLPTISDVLSQPGAYPWRALAALNPEKLISDLLESTLGAIYISTSGSLSSCNDLLQRFGILPWLSRALDHAQKAGRASCWHPKEELGMLADRREVKYETWPVLDAEDNEKVMELGKGVWRCEVTLLPEPGREDGEEVKFTAQGWDRRDAEVGAAEEAVKALKELRQSGREMVAQEGGEEVGEKMSGDSGEAGTTVEEQRARTYDAMRLERKRKFEDDGKNEEPENGNDVDRSEV